MDFAPAIRGKKVWIRENIWSPCEINSFCFVQVSKIGAELLNRALFFAFFKNHATGGQELFFCFM